MNLSVIVPARNEAAGLGPTLRSLLAAADFAAPARIEILVVDSASADGTADLARRLGVRVLESPIPGAGHARNLGARHARGDLLVFVDADTHVPLDAFTRVITHRDNGFDGGLSRLAALDGGLRARLWWLFWDHIRLLPLARAKAMSAFMFCTREAFDAFGPFDERVQIAEEWPILSGLYRARPTRFHHDRHLTARSSSRRMQLQPFGYTRTFTKYAWAVLHPSGRTHYPDTFRAPTPPALPRTCSPNQRTALPPTSSSLGSTTAPCVPGQPVMLPSASSGLDSAPADCAPGWEAALGAPSPGLGSRSVGCVPGRRTVLAPTSPGSISASVSCARAAGGVASVFAASPDADNAGAVGVVLPPASRPSALSRWFARTVSAAPMHTVRVNGRAAHLEKRRRPGLLVLIPLWNLWLAAFGEPIRVLSGRAWHARERALYRTSSGRETVRVSGRQLLVPLLPGLPADDLLRLDAVEAAAALTAAALALRNLHAAGETHGDAILGNVLLDPDLLPGPAAACWIDFETCHTAALPPPERCADDLWTLARSAAHVLGPDHADVIAIATAAGCLDEVTRRCLALEAQSATRSTTVLALARVPLTGPPLDALRRAVLDQLDSAAAVSSPTSAA